MNIHVRTLTYTSFVHVPTVMCMYPGKLFLLTLRQIELHTFALYKSKTTYIYVCLSNIRYRKASASQERPSTDSDTERVPATAIQERSLSKYLSSGTQFLKEHPMSDVQ